MQWGALQKLGEVKEVMLRLGLSILASLISHAPCNPAHPAAAHSSGSEEIQKENGFLSFSGFKSFPSLGGLA